VLFAVILAAVAQGAAAQDWTQYYTVVHRGNFKIDWGQFYRTAEAKTMEVRKELRNDLDVPYGKDPKQRLDVYFPQKASNAPVLLFLHGGGFREGDRKQYGYVAEPFAKQGIITVVASYRLTPQSAHPAQSDDAKAAVAWIYRNIAKRGGNPNAIYISGHSAGAILTADIGADLSWLDQMKIPRAAVRGIVPISGPYDLVGGWKELSEYVPTQEAAASASALRHVNAPAPVAIVAYGSLEERFMGTSADLVKALEAKGAKASLLVLDGKDHAGTVWDLSDANSTLTKAMLAMIKPAS
jgi:arylformamidase